MDLAVVGDLRSSLRVLNQLEFSVPDLDHWRKRLQEEFAAFETQLQQMAASTSIPMHPMRLVKELEAETL